MTPTKSSRVRVTVGMPRASIRAADRPHAVAQEPQAALPMMTASTPLRLTCSIPTPYPRQRCALLTKRGAGALVTAFGPDVVHVQNHPTSTELG
jgi:hypothetical protein